MKSLEIILCVPLVVLCLKVVVEAEPLQLDANNFQKSIESGKAHFVKFYAPWWNEKRYQPFTCSPLLIFLLCLNCRCGHCKKLAPTWDQLADKLDDRVIVAKVSDEISCGEIKCVNSWVHRLTVLLRPNFVLSRESKDILRKYVPLKTNSLWVESKEYECHSCIIIL